MSIPTKFNITATVENQRIKDLLCSAFEGGSNYWIKIVTRPNRTTWPAGVEYFHELPVSNVAITVRTMDDEPGDKHGGKGYTLDRAALDRGLRVMVAKYPKHMADFLMENDDAITADVFLQCCLFGEVVYG